MSFITASKNRAAGTSLSFFQFMLAAHSPRMTELIQESRCCCSRGKKCPSTQAQQLDIILPGTPHAIVANLVAFLYTGDAKLSHLEIRPFLDLVAMLDVRLPRQLQQGLEREASKQELSERQNRAAGELPMLRLQGLTARKRPAAMPLPGPPPLFKHGRMSQQPVVSKQPSLVTSPMRQQAINCARCYKSFPTFMARSVHTCEAKHIANDELGQDSSSYQDDGIPEVQLLDDDDQPMPMPLASNSIVVGTKANDPAAANNDPAKAMSFHCLRADSAFELITIKDESVSGDENEEENRSHRCRYCLDLFNSRDELLAHYSGKHFMAHLKKEFGHLPACPSCGKTFEDDGSGDNKLLLHLGTVHKKVSLCK